ncbi:MAG: asparagine synthase (glutamine-hydrolyzing) [Acidobacteria bacterium]|nr:asparagine synthase (glutamine-hydrolyzing) [Acidobacteriota bacterium]
MDALDRCELPPAAGTGAELLRARYIAQGESFLDAAEGRFAVAVLDRAAGRALIARDGLGHASLAYLLDGARFAVASQEAALVELPGVSRALDATRLAEFFANEELSGARTFFRGLHALLPGEMLIVEGERVRRRELPRPSLEARLELPRFEDYVERFAELLRESVARCLRGVEKAAVLTGGGLDSAPLAAHAARQLTAGGRANVTLLSWRVTDPAADESLYAEALAAALPARLEWIDAHGAWPFAELERWPVHPSTPEQTAYRWLHERAYQRAARRGHRVVLAGFGGDALYGHGERWFFHLLLAQGAGAAIDRLRRAARDLGWPRALRAHLLAPLLPRSRRLRRAPARYLTEAARHRLAARPRWPPEVARARRPRQAERLLALLDGHGEQVEAWYASAHGLEQRTPLRDFRLVEFALAVPDHVLGDGGETRAVLRAAVRGLVPEQIRARRGKADFRSLLLRGLEPERLGWARARLRARDALWRGTVEESAVARWLAGRFDGDAERVAFLHCLYGELWRERSPAAPRSGQPLD